MADTGLNTPAPNYGYLNHCPTDGVDLGVLFSGLRDIAFSFQHGGARAASHSLAHAGRYAKFWLDPVLVADVRGFRANEMTEIRKMVIENAQFFLEKWNDYFDGEN